MTSIRDRLSQSDFPIGLYSQKIIYSLSRNARKASSLPLSSHILLLYTYRHQWTPGICTAIRANRPLFLLTIAHTVGLVGKVSAGVAGRVQLARSATTDSQYKGKTLGCCSWCGDEDSLIRGSAKVRYIIYAGDAAAFHGEDQVRARQTDGYIYRLRAVFARRTACAHLLSLQDSLGNEI